MNHSYRLVWNDGCHAWMPVGENAKARGKRSGKASMPPVARSLGTIAVAGALLALPLVAQAKTAADVGANALPTGFLELRGSGNTAYASGNLLDVTQAGQRAVFGWDSFDVGTAATVHFKQQAGAIALNIIGGADPSFILGKLKADSTVFFVNPNGMFFGNGASVNVGSMLATTMSMDPDEFMNGRYRLTKPGIGVIRNEGLIKAAGSVSLIGNSVENIGKINDENAGKIVATTVTFAAGNAVAIELTGDGLIRARVEAPALKASLSNSGRITATLAVTLTAGQARDTLDRLVNNSGVIRATGLAARGGDIVLEGGLVTNSGTLDASSATGKGGSISLLGRNVELAATSVIDASGTSGGNIKVMGDMSAGHVEVDGWIYAKGGSGDGGLIETSADEVHVADSFRINALSAHGHAGKWLIDPIDFTILLGSGALTSSGIGATTLSNALEGADVTIATDNVNNLAGNYGDIYVYSPVFWSAATTLTLNAYRHIYMNAGLTAQGNGSVVLRADSTGTGTGTVYFGASGAITIAGSGRADIYYNPAGGYNGANKSDSTHDPYSSYVTGTHTAWMLVNKVADLFNSGGVYGFNTVNDDLDGNYAMGRNIDFASAYYGYGYRPIGSYTAGTPFTGKFDGLEHTISNLAITGCTGAFTSPCIGYQNYVGLFAQTSSTAVIQNLGLINVTVDTDTGTAYASNVGALVGSNGGQIINSYAIGTIGSSSHTPKGSYVGGLAGSNSGTVRDSHADMIVYGSNYTGGLAGYNSGTVSGSYATGDVYSTGNTGGLVGFNNSYGMITGSHATGKVTGSSFSAGGLVGESDGSIQRSYATGNVFGYAMVGGLVGYNTTTAHIADSYATGTVASTSSTGYTGGLVGDNTGGIANSYAAGLTTAAYPSYFGALTGSNSSPTGSIQNSFWNKDTSCGAPPCNTGIGPGAGGSTATNSRGLTSADMKAMASFTGWDISISAGGSSKWVIDEGVSYPVLRAPSLAPLVPLAGSPGTITTAASDTTPTASLVPQPTTGAITVAAATVASIQPPKTGKVGTSFAGLADSPTTTTTFATLASKDKDGNIQLERPKGRMLVCRRGA